MKLKSYFAQTVEAALGLAREELGPEAMLVESRKAPPEAGRAGDYEVVFGLAAGQSGEPPSVRRRTPEPQAAGSGKAPKLGQSGLDGLREEIRQMRRAIWRAGLNAAGSAAPFSDRAEVLSILAEAELDPRLASEVAACVEARLSGDPLLERDAAGQAGGVSERKLERILLEELEGRLMVDATVGSPGGSPRIVALVGPCGCGKTTTLAKLAVHCGLEKRSSIQFLCLDTYRVAAAEQLRCLAAILGAGFEVLDTPAGLDQALGTYRQKGLILIDTPGYGAADMDIAADLASYLGRRPEIDVQLVLPASMKPADLAHVVDRFDVFRPSKLLFTKLDETGSFGPILSEAVRTGKPVSFLTIGQRIPDDLEEASPGRMASRILVGHPKAIPAAA
jgi:flagellar biosynthesis protein FlhF